MFSICVEGQKSLAYHSSGITDLRHRARNFRYCISLKRSLADLLVPAASDTLPKLSHGWLAVLLSMVC